MAYNPSIHHRKSIRLKGYDYSKAGLYFITICVQNKEHLFGSIFIQTAIVGADLRVCPEMQLNDAGKMIEKWYFELMNKFPNIVCREMVIMPNHFHCIIEIISPESVGADLRVCPEMQLNDAGKMIKK